MCVQYNVNVVAPLTARLGQLCRWPYLTVDSLLRGLWVLTLTDSGRGEYLDCMPSRLVVAPESTKNSTLCPSMFSSTVGSAMVLNPNRRMFPMGYAFFF